MKEATVIVSFEGNSAKRRVVEETLGDVCRLIFLPDLTAEERGKALSNADALIANNLRVELRSDEFQQLQRVKVIQLLTAGVDHAPFSSLPADIPVSYVPGAFGADNSVVLTLTGDET